MIKIKEKIFSYVDRKNMIESIKGVDKVIPQDTLSYRKNLEILKPDYVVHGDDWKVGIQQPIRAEVCDVLASYGGKLVEYPYSKNEKYEEIVGI